MEKERYTFRLSEETIKKLDDMIERGIIENRTEGVIRGISMFYEIGPYDPRSGDMLDIVNMITKAPQIAKDWPDFPVGTSFPVYYNPDTKIFVKKISQNNIELVRESDKHRLIINIKEDDNGTGEERPYKFSFVEA